MKRCLVVVFAVLGLGALSVNGSTATVESGYFTVRTDGYLYDAPQFTSVSQFEDGIVLNPTFQENRWLKIVSRHMCA